VKYRAHPEIVKEMSLFMLTERVDPTEMVQLRDDVSTATSNVADAEKLTNTYKDKIDKVTKELGDLKTVVNHLKQPAGKKRKQNEGAAGATP
jgi:phage-related minor tail protein